MCFLLIGMFIFTKPYSSATSPNWTTVTIILIILPMICKRLLFDKVTKIFLKHCLVWHKAYQMGNNYKSYY